MHLSASKIIKRDLLILWISIAVVALVLMWLMLQLSLQGSGSQIAQARARASISCEALRAGAQRASSAVGPAGSDDLPIPRSALSAVIDLALRDEPGMEGGFWQSGKGIVAYAFPTYDGTGVKRDPPSAELDRIESTAQRAQAAASQIVDVRPGLREAVVFVACPVDAAPMPLIAWNLRRVPVLSEAVMSRLIVALSLLLGFVLVSGAWLGWMLTRWRRQTDLLTQQLAQSERLATLGRLSAGLAHEIRNPLGTMRMKAENALAASSEMRETRVAGALEAVLTQTSRLEELVSSLLALTQPFRLQRKPLLLTEWMQERARTHREAAASNDIRIDLSIDRDTSAQTRQLPLFDPAQMARVFDNLILNALAHVQAGGRIELGAQRLPSGRLLLWVADDGSGIPAELHATVFEPFITGRAGGTGLGLSLAREIVQAHGGTITLATTPRGARFEMEFPWPAF
ncbi:sensor histidine kinase [Herbaspirillum lusitanum]|uniref:sensor histidine kinase n=1 Tax=Herbaspirillum lusitanum TaxID=213312 RepID=UPI0038B92693